jgi:hypothetical protein
MGKNIISSERWQGNHKKNQVFKKQQQPYDETRPSINRWRNSTTQQPPRSSFDSVPSAFPIIRNKQSKAEGKNAGLRANEHKLLVGQFFAKLVIENLVPVHLHDTTHVVILGNVRA